MMRDTIDMKSDESWRRCVVNLQHATERMQATADAIPPELTPAMSRSSPEMAALLERHLITFGDYTVALSCLHAVLATHGIVAALQASED